MSRSARGLKYSAAAISLSLLCGCASAPTAPPEEPIHRVRTGKLTPKARMELEPAEELEPGRVVRAIRGNESTFRKCFFRDPSQRGIIRIGWDVNEEGVAHDARVVRSTVKSSPIEDCLVKEVEALRFGELRTPGEAKWTFVFRLVDGVPKGKGAKRRRRAKAKSPEPGVEIDERSPGWLDPGKIDSVVNYGYRLFARCYRDGIQRDSSLNGATRFRFVIDEEGRVAGVRDDKSDLPDRIVIDCMAEMLYALEFPKPENGRVHVRYRMQFN